MPAKITFTQAEETELEYVIAGGMYKFVHLPKLLEKMKKARVKDKEPAFHGISVKEFIDAANKVLGTRLKTPENFTKEWIIKMQRALNSGGVSKEVADKGLAAVKVQWSMPDIWIETLIYSIPKLAAGVSSGSPVKKMGYTPTKKSGWLAQIDED